VAIAGEPNIDIDNVARELSNPNSSLSTLGLKFQYWDYTGDLPKAGQQSGSTLIIQAGLPYFLDNGDKVILRPSLRIAARQPGYDRTDNEFDSRQGLGDLNFDLSYAPTLGRQQFFAAGVVGIIPTATHDSLGSNHWALGPTFRFGKMTDNALLGIYASQHWGLGGSGTDDINLSTVQLVSSYLPGGGWSYGSSPQMAYTHEAEQWTIPLNFNFGRTLVRNGKPMKFSIEINYFVEQPDIFGPEWMLSLNITPVVKKNRRKLFKRLPCTSASGCN
jgi:hypothetical protein